jgi:tryptophan-rich sensory protein
MADAVQRRDWWKLALVCVVGIELLGGLSGWLAQSSDGNPWFDALAKPSFMPPGFVFGIVWPVLYALLGMALALILAEPASDRRRVGLILFALQMVLNFAWSPIFFAGHDIRLAKIVIFVMAVLAAAAAGQFFRLRAIAGWLMAPYLGWLVFAATLTATIERLNPAASVSLLGF